MVHHDFCEWSGEVTAEELANEIQKIINQDTESVSDGEVLDQIYILLEGLKNDRNKHL
jgi:hypothetical protein